MKREIFLIDELNLQIISSAEKYILRFDSGANVSIELDESLNSFAMVFRAWFGEHEWLPASEGTCNLILNPFAGNSILINPIILTGSSLFDVRIKAVSKDVTKVFACTNEQEQLIDSKIKAMIIKDKETGLLFEIKFPQIELAALYRESIFVTANHGIVCEPKGANLWVIKHLSNN